jgi:hypothetical protein
MTGQSKPRVTRMGVIGKTVRRAGWGSATGVTSTSPQRRLPFIGTGLAGDLEEAEQAFDRTSLRETWAQPGETDRSADHDDDYLPDRRRNEHGEDHADDGDCRTLAIRRKAAGHAENRMCHHRDGRCLQPLNPPGAAFRSQCRSAVREATMRIAEGSVNAASCSKPPGIAGALQPGTGRARPGRHRPDR